MTPTTAKPGYSLTAITPKPHERILMCGSTGSGKSTLGCLLLEQYHALHPHHQLYIFDFKRIFFPHRYKEESRIFPEGIDETVFRDRRGIHVQAKLLKGSMGFRFPDERIFLIQEYEKAIECMDWLYQHPSARVSRILYIDEPLELMPNGRAVQPLLLLFQQGRQLSIGTWVGYQRPRMIAQVMFSETELMYVGMLHHPDDQKRIVELTPRSLQPIVREPLDKHEWTMIDRIHPQRSMRRFHLALR
jgi:hypothetical protein